MKLQYTLLSFIFGLLVPLISFGQINFDLKYRSSVDTSTLIRIQTSEYHFKIQSFVETGTSIKLIEENRYHFPIISRRLNEGGTLITFLSGLDSLVIKKSNDVVIANHFRNHKLLDSLKESYDFDYDDLKYANYNWEKPCIRLEKVNSNFLIKDKETQITFFSYGVPKSDLILTSKSEGLITKQGTFGSAFVNPKKTGLFCLSIYSLNLDSMLYSQSFTVVESLDQIHSNKKSEINEVRGCNYIGKGNDIFLKSNVRNDLRLVLSGYSYDDLSIEVAGGELKEFSKQNCISVTPTGTKFKIIISDSKTNKILISKEYIVR